MRDQLAINRRHVVCETIDDETILIHLGTGIYYSLDGVGSVIWQLAEAGHQPADIAAAIREAFPDVADPGAVVRTLIGELVLEDLLVEGAPENVGAPPVVAWPATFADPALQKYTDMQEFMLVDPLHEVEEEAGWPHVKAG
jgi:hypothetical protein